ncbi:hypothetical protein B6V72_17200 [Thioclava sp. F34-6]|uniref:GlcG/HbpS family heme-binding protein n=1 Tax=Thioclava sp. F34-6 TaxID=1973003 RepID=UPI000B53DD16|nr:heme-binding protein [Thioclava sp. F34-6]OWY10352.1 hypothetical protein B6V72_17200 [Thioclava sp. F34-6]
MNIPYKCAAQAIAEAHDQWLAGEEDPYTVTVLDAGRNLVAFAKLDGARIVSIEASSGKAYSAVSLEAPSDEYLPLVAPGQPLYGLETSQSKPLVLFKGGMPVFSGGKLSGGVGVSGGPLEQDERIATMIANRISELMG